MKLAILEPKVAITGGCACCVGQGVIANPAWTAFFHAVNEGKASTDNPEPWFEEQGLTDSARSGKPVLPPEEITCAECEGRGSLTKFVSLADFKALLL
jgi:hypothetical protein